MVRKLKKCLGTCGKERYIWAKGMCKDCYQKPMGFPTRVEGQSEDFAAPKDTKKAEKKKPYSSIKKKFPKPTGEAALFQTLWNTREHKCFSCGRHLGDEAKAHYFSHTIQKNKREDLRLLDRNIQLECMECHHTWDFGTLEQKSKMKSFSKKMDFIKEMDTELFHIMSYKYQEVLNKNTDKAMSRNSQEMGKAFEDLILFGQVIEHHDGEGNVRVVDPMSDESANIREIVEQQALWLEALEAISAHLQKENNNSDDNWGVKIAELLSNKFTITKKL